MHLTETWAKLSAWDQVMGSDHPYALRPGAFANGQMITSWKLHPRGMKFQNRLKHEDGPVADIMLLGKKRHITSAVGGDDRRRFGSLHPLGNVDGRAIDANKGGHGDGGGTFHVANSYWEKLKTFQEGWITPLRRCGVSLYGIKSWRCPRDSDALLSYLYGPKWKTQASADLDYWNVKGSLKGRGGIRRKHGHT